MAYEDFGAQLTLVKQEQEHRSLPLPLRIRAKLSRKIDATDFMKLHRRKKLNNTDFSIICNNCWGGFISRYFGLPYLSPTVGLAFYADEFIKFSKDLKYYLSQNLIFIENSDSKYAQAYEFKKHRYTDFEPPTGLLGDVEIMFRHFKTREEAYEKWNRRVERVNFDNLIFKFSNAHMAEEHHLKEFDALPHNKKIMFTQKPRPDLKCAIYYRGFEHMQHCPIDTFNIDMYEKYFLNLINK